MSAPFTPTEAAGIGAFGALLFTLFKRVLDRGMLFRVLAETGVTTSMLFVVLIGALIFANFINETGMPNQLADFVRSLAIPPLYVIFGIMAIYILLGCVFESLSMLLLTVPVFVPLIVTMADGPGHDQGGSADLVRHRRGGGNRNQPDHAAGRPERLCPARRSGRMSAPAPSLPASRPSGAPISCG